MTGRRNASGLWSQLGSFILAGFLVAIPALAQKVSTFQKVYIGTDTLAHVVTRDGTDHAIPAEPEQVAVSDPRLSPDRRVAGWQVEQDNCCTSYPIPTRLVLHSRNAHRVLANGQMIYGWCFVPATAAVAVSSGTVHGMQGQNITLYSTRSGKQLKQWSGDEQAKPPAWADCLDQQTP